MLTTLVCTDRPTDFELVASLLPKGRPTVYCATPQDVLAQVRHGPVPAAIIWYVVPARHTPFVEALRTLRTACPTVAQLFRLTLAPDAAYSLVTALDATPGGAMISVAGHDDLSSDLGLLFDGRHAGTRADAIILSRIGEARPWSSSDLASYFITATTLLGRRPIDVRTFCQALGLSPARFRQQWRASGLPDARVLLAWSVVLHCVAEAELAGTPLKAIALRMGFRSAEALTNRMSRLSGMRFREARRHGGFGAILQHFAEMLRRVPRPPRAVELTAIEACVTHGLPDSPSWAAVALRAPALR